MWETLQASFSSPDFWKYISIPFISGLVGWVTNMLALKMTFYPLNFVGIGPIGWQGIIPSKAAAMGRKAVDLLTEKLITIEDRFDQIEPDRVAEEMEPALRSLTSRILEEILEEEAPVLWETAPPVIKKGMLARAKADIPYVVSELMEEVKANISDLFDLKGMVVEELEKDRDLLNQIFLKVGDAEFRFIERSGLYFGFVFGLFQMGLFWGLNTHNLPAAWVLPTAGLIVGWATNVLALRMIFRPMRAKRIGFWTFHGLFIKRQMEVSQAYAEIVTHRILTSENILSRMISGPASDQLMRMIHGHIKTAVDEIAGMGKPLFQLTAGIRTYVRVKKLVAQRFVEELPHTIKHIFAYTEEALDIEETLRIRMQALSETEFAGFLRPIFQEDEWKLILVGAMLGAVAGFAQLLWFLP